MREMKDSGIEWIWEIPREWTVVRSKYVFTHHKIIVGNAADDYDRLSLTNQGIAKRSKEDISGLQPKNFETYQMLYKNELVFRLIDLGNISPNRVGLSPYTGIISAAYTILSSNEDVLPDFAEKWFLSMSQRLIFNSLRDDGVRSGINTEALLNVNIALPPINEQHSIANFLNRKCAAIDEIASDIENEIKVLQQYKHSLITEAVTKGLNRDVEMKDSSIEWIGMIPDQWNVDKLKYHLIRNETHNSDNKPVLSLYREYGIVLKDSREDNHNVTSEDTSNYKYVQQGDFVINKMKAWQGSVAVSDFEGIVSPAYYVYKFTDLNIHKRYFHYLLRGCYKDEFRRLSGGIREGQWDLPAEAFENTLILIPSFNEQKVIADLLDKVCSGIDSITNCKHEQLTKLINYKKSLIYEYVTGKKEAPTV